MDKVVVKRFAPFTPLAKPLGPMDPFPVFEWKVREETPDREFKLEISKDGGMQLAADAGSAEESRADELTYF